ncbi:hypothetical protein LINPERPRIM_LOCUS30421 [Linum perenne]
MQDDSLVNPRCPQIQSSEAKVRSFYKPWTKALVVKVLERPSRIQFLNGDSRIFGLGQDTYRSPTCPTQSTSSASQTLTIIIMRHSDGHGKFTTITSRWLDGPRNSMRKNLYRKYSCGFVCLSSPSTIPIS